MRREQIAGRIYDILAANPSGVTKPALAAELGVCLGRVDKGISALRAILADDDTINVVADKPDSGRGPWLFRLVGTFDAARPWNEGFAAMVLGTARTWRNVNVSFGDRESRKVSRAIIRLIEDLEEVMP